MTQTGRPVRDVRPTSVAASSVPATSLQLLLVHGHPLQGLLLVLADGILDQHIVHDALVGQGQAGDWGGVVVGKPGLQGSPLVGVSISCYHRVPHQPLCHRHACNQMNNQVPRAAEKRYDWAEQQHFVISLQGSPLVGVSVSCYHMVPHQALCQHACNLMNNQAACVLEKRYHWAEQQHFAMTLKIISQCNRQLNYLVYQKVEGLSRALVKRYKAFVWRFWLKVTLKWHVKLCNLQ